MTAMEQTVIAIQNDMAAFKALEAQHHIDTNAKVDGLAQQMTQALIDFKTLQIAVNARSDSAGSQGGGNKAARLDFHAAKDIAPTAPWHGLDDKKVHWREFSEEIMNYTSALCKDSKEVLDEVEIIGEEGEVNILHIGAGDPDMVDLLNATLYGTLYKYTADTARKITTSAGRGNGLQAWHDLCHYARPVSVSDEQTEYFKILNPNRAKDEAALGLSLNVWTSQVHEFEKRYAPIEERSKKVGLMALVPKETYDKRLLGTTEDLPYKDLLVKIKAIARDRTMTNAASKKAVSINTAMDLDTVTGEGEKQDNDNTKKESDLAEKLEALNAFVKGTGWGKGGGKPQGTQYQPYYPNKSGKADQGGKGGGKAGGKGGKGGKAGAKGGKGQNQKELVCYNCGGKGHPARLCPTAPTHQELGEEWPEAGEEPEEEADDFFELAEDTEEEEQTLRVCSASPVGKIP